MKNDSMTHFGESLAEKIRTSTKDFNSLSDFEKFVLNRGHLYETEELLKEGYDRKWKANHGLKLTKAEFIAEAQKSEKDRAEEVYDTLLELVGKERLTPGDLYQYAVFRWCIRDPEAITAYQGDNGKWIVNNCDVAISDEAARLTVCEEFGFEASRVKIIGVPRYDATDWNYIRFNCAGRAYLMHNGDLSFVYDEWC